MYFVLKATKCVVASDVETVQPIMCSILRIYKNIVLFNLNIMLLSLLKAKECVVTSDTDIIQLVRRSILRIHKQYHSINLNIKLLNPNFYVQFGIIIRCNRY